MPVSDNERFSAGMRLLVTGVLNSLGAFRGLQGARLEVEVDEHIDTKLHSVVSISQEEFSHAVAARLAPPSVQNDPSERKLVLEAV